ncbi:ribonuclease HII [Flavobacteriaceae bacterium 3-367]
MKFSTVLVLTFLLFFGCQQEKVVSSSLLAYVPQNASAIIKVNDLSSFKSELKNNDFLSKLKGTKLHTAVFDKLKGLDYVQTDTESVIAFTELGKDNLEFIYVVSQSADFLQLTDITDKTIETVSYEQHTFKKYTIEGSIFYGTVLDGKTVISSSPILLENLIRKRGELSTLGPLKKLYEIANTNKSATFFINTQNGDALISSILNENAGISMSRFSDWVSLDLSMGQDYINFNGIAMANDSLKKFTNLFWNTGPLPHTTPAFAPITADGFLSYTFDDYDVFAKNQQKYLDRSIAMDTVFNTVEEVGIIFLNTKKAVVLNTYGSENITQFLDGLKKGTVDYQGTEITSLAANDFLNEIFNPLIQNFEANYYAILENSFVFSGDRESLQTVISNFKNSSTYNKAPSFDTAKTVLADESNLLFVADNKGLQQILKEDFSSDLLKDLQRAKLSKYAFAGQLVTDDTFYHTNLILKKIGREAKLNTTSPLFTVQLDSDLATTPQFVINHRTNKKEIVVQDKDNYVYLISTAGKVLWKKQLEGRIQGKIEQVDIYRNGRLQLAFTTDNQFLILDRNGEEVPPFTKKFSGGNLNPLAVFDYERKKDYRFVITQGSKVFMYNNQGAIVSGFKYTAAESPIIKVPRHFRIGKRDYLCFVLENKSLKILNRVGDVRTKVSEKIDFSENEVYLYKNKFSTTDKKGTLVQIDEAGKTTRSSFNLNKDHGMDATSKTLALINDNTLSIKGKKVELDLGVYTKPKIFYLYDKIYVSVTDIQNQKIYLFDSNAKPIQNFPIYGNSLIDLADMDNDHKLELVAKDLENSLIIYKMN